MRFLRPVGRFLLDWRNGATLCASALIVMLAFTVVDGTQSRREAFKASQAQAEQALSAQRAATARITEMRAQIAGLESTSDQRGGQIAELRTQVVALAEQVRQMGGRPVVVLTTPSSTTTSSTASRATTTTTTRPSSTSTTTTAPQPTTTTTTPTRCLSPVLSVPPGCHP